MTGSSGGGATVTGTNYGIPLRDSSDYIRMLKNRIVYQENKNSNRSNQTRVNYQFGQITCNAGNCPAFPKSAPPP